MKPTLHLTAMACALCARPVFAGEPINPKLDFADMRVVVTYVSPGELWNLQRSHGAAVDPRDLNLHYRRGFSLLKRNRETGALTCEIYLSDEERPREVDDAATQSLGHELLHCMLGDYHR
jgi:hypothetical protein